MRFPAGMCTLARPDQTGGELSDPTCRGAQLPAQYPHSSLAPTCPVSALLLSLPLPSPPLLPRHASPVRRRWLTSSLQSASLYVYMGHGAGDHLLPPGALRRLSSCASSLLMGCSSARLRPRGTYDPAGPALAYLEAGAPFVVGNLWDVTDRDIDRFAAALLEGWVGRGGARAAEGAGEVEVARDAGDVCTPAAGRRRGRLAAMGLGLGTPGATPAALTTARKGRGKGARLGRMGATGVEKGGGDASGVGEGDEARRCGGVGISVACAVREARAACRLRSLIGGAPVVYGLPCNVVPVPQR